MPCLRTERVSARIVEVTGCISSQPFGPSATRMFATASCLRSRLRLPHVRQSWAPHGRGL